VLENFLTAKYTIMATKHLMLSDLHFSHKLWQKELSFYLDEITIYEGYLAEVAQRWTDKNVLNELEHFQNQFIIQKEQAEILSHDVKTTQESLESFAKNNQTAIDHKYFDSSAEMHQKMADRAETYKKIYNELKSDFRVFLSKYM
jgi:hypothetical protein